MSMDPNMIRMMLAQRMMGAPQTGGQPQAIQPRVSPMSGASDIVQRLMLMRALQRSPQQMPQQQPLQPQLPPDPAAGSGNQP